MRRGALWWYWYARGDHAEARELVGFRLELPTAQRPSLGRARALATYGVMTWEMGGPAGALALRDESLVVTRQFRTPRPSQKCCCTPRLRRALSAIFSRATAACNEALELAREAGPEHIASSALTILGRVAVLRSERRGHRIPAFRKR